MPGVWRCLLPPGAKEVTGFSFLDGYCRRRCKACGGEFGTHECVFALPDVPPRGLQRQPQGEGRPRQYGHRQLVGDAGDNRGAQPDAYAGQEQIGAGESRQGILQADRGNDNQRHQHRRRQPIDPRPAALLSQAVGQQDVQHEQNTVRQGKEQAERLTGELELG